MAATTKRPVIAIRYALAAAEGTYLEAFRPPTHTRAYWTNRIWGAPGSINNFLLEMSRGRFGFDVAKSVVSPTVYVLDNTKLKLDKDNNGKLSLDGSLIRGEAIKAAQADINFSRYDRNRSGTLTPDDAIVLVIAASDSRGGQFGSARQQGTTPAAVPVDVTVSGLKVTGNAVGAFGAAASISLITHEIMHALGAVDIYGLWESDRVLNSPGSLMGSSGTNPSHLDPMHKTLLGWTEPRLVEAGTNSTAELVAPTVPGDTNSHRPLLVYSARRKAAEFFILEYRTHAAASAVAGDNFEGSLASSGPGLAIWRVTMQRGQLKGTPGYIHRNKQGRPAAADKAASTDLFVQTNGTWNNHRIRMELGTGRVYASSPNGGLYTFAITNWTGPKPNPLPHRGSASVTTLRPERGPGRGWDRYLDMFAGGDGVLYGITPDGELAWYRHDPAEPSGFWNEGAENVISTGFGWDDYKQVFPGGDGVIYAITKNGSLLWYRHTGSQTGRWSWNDTDASRISTGRSWHKFWHVFAGGGGTIYAISDDGRLQWYRHTGVRTGRPNWVKDGRAVDLGGNWTQYEQVWSGGNGTLFGLAADGSVDWYRHTGWQTGSANFQSTRAVELPTSGKGPNFLYVTFGTHGLLTTRPGPGDTPVDAPPINIISAPDGTMGTPHGLWRAEHGVVPITMSDGQVIARVSVEPLPHRNPESADSIRVRIRPA
ncbi:tachylectin-related carbohydrate-binding protein [Nostocoides sp. F2B08]|uniref:tachylectin-related carbohydrate-binding protein n=1 Tax=Nostocoides sp. F2B08 TaxID=2653936 RepID=UPI00186AF142|nr:tachylectin-related carbohydrate-binding protein [Tetrasphaera sp. F2B08]